MRNIAEIGEQIARGALTPGKFTYGAKVVTHRVSQFESLANKIHTFLHENVCVNAPSLFPSVRSHATCQKGGVWHFWWRRQSSSPFSSIVVLTLVLPTSHGKTRQESPARAFHKHAWVDQLVYENVDHVFRPYILPNVASQFWANWRRGEIVLASLLRSTRWLNCVRVR